MKITKNQVLSTLVTYYSNYYGHWITISPMLPDVITGVSDDNKLESEQCFKNMLDDAWEHFTENKVAGFSYGEQCYQSALKRGISGLVKPDTQKKVMALRDETGLEVGQILDYVLESYWAWSGRLDNDDAADEKIEKVEAKLAELRKTDVVGQEEKERTAEDHS